MTQVYGTAPKLKGQTKREFLADAETRGEFEWSDDPGDRIRRTRFARRRPSMPRVAWLERPDPWLPENLRAFSESEERHQARAFVAVPEQKKVQLPDGRWK